MADYTTWSSIRRTVFVRTLLIFVLSFRSLPRLPTHLTELASFFFQLNYSDFTMTPVSDPIALLLLNFNNELISIARLQTSVTESCPCSTQWARATVKVIIVRKKKHKRYSQAKWFKRRFGESELPRQIGLKSEHRSTRFMSEDMAALAGGYTTLKYILQPHQE